MKILLGDFNAKVGREDIFKPVIGQENLHQDSDNSKPVIIENAKSHDMKICFLRAVTKNYR